MVSCPYRVLLVHHVAANDATVVIHHECTVAALADRTDSALWYSVCVVGVAELIE